MAVFGVETCNKAAGIVGDGADARSPWVVGGLVRETRNAEAFS